MNKNPRKTILSYGLGVDSTAILHRWLTRPQCRDFDLKDLIVITAMTGDEFSDTGVLVERHILPLLRQHRVRYVQIARAGLLEKDGIAVLSDTDRPERVFLEGLYRLSEELIMAGTVPQIASGRRWCSQKYKGQVIDSWIESELKGQPYTHVIGFNADEERRVLKDQVYGGSSPNRTASYPLVEWTWGRIGCEAYLRHMLGENWKKSACSFCPFSRGEPHVVERYRELPEEAAFALFMEYVCLCLNPKMLLFGVKSLHEVLVKDGNHEALKAFQKRLEATEWGLYRVRRIAFSKNCVWRKVECQATGTRNEMNRELAGYGDPDAIPFDIRRVTLKARGTVFPATEDCLAVAPLGVADKSRPNFEKRWKEFSRRKPVCSL